MCKTTSAAWYLQNLSMPVKYQTLFDFIFFCAIYNLVIFAFETSLTFTLKIKNMWKKQLHAC